MRSLLLPFAFLLLHSAYAQQEVRITDARALDQARDVRKAKGAEEALEQKGFPKVEIGTILEYGDRSMWPEVLRSDTARASHAPYIVNYSGFRLASFSQDTVLFSVVMIPAMYNTHMPDGMRPLGDFYLVLPESALTNAEKPQPRPAVSRGPKWDHRPKAKIIKPDGLYGAYNLGTDSAGLRALEALGLSREETEAVVFRSTERNWPEGIASFEKRFPRLERFRKYKAYFGAKWDDKVLLIVPAARNRRMPVVMRPYMDLYFVYSAKAVKVEQKK